MIIKIIINQKYKITPNNVRRINEDDISCEDKDDVRNATTLSPVDYKISEKIFEFQFQPELVGFFINNMHNQDVYLSQAQMSKSKRKYISVPFKNWLSLITEQHY